MKMLTAIIKPHKLDEVNAALEKIGLTGMTVSEVKGHGRQRGHTEIYRGAEYTVDFLPKLKLEIVVGNEVEKNAIEAISKAAKTGQIGDGKIFSWKIDSAVRIRTGESGEEAL